MARSEAPETLEGWFIQHDMYTVKWPEWRNQGSLEHELAVKQSTEWLAAQAAPEQGMSAFFSVLGPEGRHPGGAFPTHPGSPQRR